MDELQRMRGIVDKAREAAAEGRRALGDVFGASVPPETTAESSEYRTASS